MALDSGIPLQVQAPNTLATVGNIASTANAIQQFQAGNIALQAQRQANVERQNLIKLFQEDPDAKALPDGTFNPALYGKVMAAAPQTGMQMISKLADNNTAVTQANKAQFNLGQEQNQQIAQTLQDQRGKPRSKAVAALDQLTEQFPGLGPRAGIIRSQLGNVRDDDQPAVDAVLNHALALTQNLAGRKEYTQPDYAVVPLGATGAVVQKNVEAPGGVTTPMKPSGEVTMSIPPGFMQDQFGNLVKVGGVGGQGPPQAKPVSPPASGLAPPAPAWMNAGASQNAKDAQARWSSAQTRDVDPASGYNATGQVYANLKDLLDKNPNIGPGSAGWNQLVGRVGTITGHKLDPNASYQEVVGYLDRLSAQNSAATGAATNFAREQQASATGNPEVMGPQAIQEKLRFGASVNEAAHAYTTASRNFISKNGPNAYGSPQLFEGAWSENADPIAFRLMAAAKDGDKADFAAIQARVAGMPLPQQQAIHQHYLNLKNYLLKGLLPPNG